MGEAKPLDLMALTAVRDFKARLKLKAKRRAAIAKEIGGEDEGRVDEGCQGGREQASKLDGKPQFSSSRQAMDGEMRYNDSFFSFFSFFFFYGDLSLCRV